MKDSEQINLVKKDIKSIEIEKNERIGQLGEIFFDSNIELEDSSIIEDIQRIESEIPIIKNRMEELKSYNLSITEAEEDVKLCHEKIKDIKSGMGSIYEKVGVELFCFVGEKELAYPEIATLYKELKEGEARSESLENKLYSYENSASKKSFLNIFSTPFHVRGIKKEIRLNNKQSLTNFRKLGEVYTNTPQLVKDESNESLLDVLEEYNKLQNSLKSQNEKLISLNKRISDNEQKIQEESDGLKLKSVYDKCEKQIVDAQNRVSKLLVDLGEHVVSLNKETWENPEVDEKLGVYKELNKKLEEKQKELVYLEKQKKYNKLLKEIKEREESLKVEREHIEKLTETLEKNKANLTEVVGESELLLKWLNDNPL